MDNNFPIASQNFKFLHLLEQLRGRDYLLWLFHN